MSQRFLFEEDYQLPAKIMRAVIWSGTMAALWAAPFVIFVGGGLTLANLTGEFTRRESLEYFLLLSIYLGGIPALMGAVTGFVGSLYAPSVEPSWGLRAPTFRAFFGHMILQLLIVAFICSLVAQTEIPLPFAAPVIGFFIALSRTCARQQKKNAA